MFRYCMFMKNRAFIVFAVLLILSWQFVGARTADAATVTFSNISAVTTGPYAEMIQATVTPASNASTTVRYGYTTSYGQTTTQALDSGQLVLGIAGLDSQTYHYQVQVTISGTTYSSADNTFTPMGIFSVLPNTNTPGTASIKVGVNVATSKFTGTASVSYGSTADYGRTTQPVALANVNSIAYATVQLPSLAAGSYHYRVNVQVGTRWTMTSGDLTLTVKSLPYWHAPVTLSAGASGPLRGVACTKSTSTCFALYGAAISTVKNGVPAAAVPVPGYFENTYQMPEAALSCPTVAVCFTTAGGSRLYGIEPVTGVRTHYPASALWLGGISCSSPTFCVTSDSNGGLITFDGASVTIKSQDAWGGSSPVSCISTSFCLLNSDYLRDGSTYSTGGVDMSYASAISCVSTTLCLGVQYGIDNFDGASWSPNEAWARDSSPGGSLNYNNSDEPTSVSCATSSFCMAMSPTGVAYKYDGNSWTSQRLANSSRAAVACGMQGSCLAVSSSAEGIQAAFFGP